MLNVKRYAIHDCHVPNKGSESCLAKLPPHAGCWMKFKRLFHKLTIAYRYHPGMKTYFRSSSAVLIERKRHIYGYPKYIIHPLSRMAFYNDMIAAFLWMYSFIVDPFLAGFWSGDSQFVALVQTTRVVNTLLLIQCGVWFISGYVEHKTNVFVLAPRKIVVRYLRRYFLWDLLGCFPFRMVLFQFSHDFDEIVFNVTFLINCLKIARFKSFLKRLKWITAVSRLSDNAHTFFVLTLLTCIILHWCSCGLFAYHRIYYYIRGYEESYSILSQLKISAAYSDVSWFRRYVLILRVVCETLCSAGEKLAYSTASSEQFFFTALMIGGSAYYVICFVTVYLLLSTAAAPEQDYENFISGVQVFMESKKLPKDLRERVNIYYTRRLQSRYFGEHNLISLLSDHLQREVWLHSCQRLLDHVSFFKQLPKAVVGVILGSLKLEVFLPQDVILKAEERFGKMFFISWGTVAVFNKDNTEIVHLTDGMYFGMPPTTKLSAMSSNYTFVAVEMTECYRWDKDCYYKCAKMFKGIATLLDDLHANMTQDFEHHEKLLRNNKQRNIISELRQGKILEKGIFRVKDVHSFEAE